jgi:hypothetical protein
MLVYIALSYVDMARTTHSFPIHRQNERGFPYVNSNTQNVTKFSIDMVFIFYKMEALILFNLLVPFCGKF